MVAPSIDALSPKNQEMGHGAVRAILARAGLADGDGSAAVFVRQNGTQGRVDRAAELDQTGPVPDQVPLVVQVSRWDRLKDPAGVQAPRSASGIRHHPLLAAVGRGGGR